MYALTYNLPNGKSFAFAPRSGTSSLGAAAVQQFFPDRWKNQTDGMAHRALPFIIREKFEDCVIVIRNPVERFASLCGRTGTPPDMALARLFWGLGLGRKKQACRNCIEGTTLDWLYHFAPIAPRLGRCQPVLFERLSDAAAMLGLGKLPHINAAESKSTLADEDQRSICEIYAADIALWESLQP